MSSTKMLIAKNATSAAVAVGAGYGIETLAEKHTDIDTKNFKFKMANNVASATIAFKTAPYTDTVIEIVAARLAARKERKQEKKTAKES